MFFYGQLHVIVIASPAPLGESRGPRLLERGWKRQPLRCEGNMNSSSLLLLKFLSAMTAMDLIEFNSLK